MMVLHELGHARENANGTGTAVNYNDPKSIQAGTKIVIDPDDKNPTKRSYMSNEEIKVRNKVDNPIREEQNAKKRASVQIVN